MRDPSLSGMLPVRPGYTCYIESFLGRSLEFGRVLSLEDESDVRQLRRNASAIPELAQALDQHLDDYVRLFPEPFWRVLYDGPVVAVPTGPSRLAAYELAYLLQIVGMYKSIVGFEGAGGILKELRNPTQIASTFFEIETAAWCATRAVTRSLQFFPAVAHGGRFTYPDYLWSTSLGDLYCECKRSSDFESRFARRVNSIVTFLNAEFGSLAQPDVRFEFLVERTSRAEESIRKLLQVARTHANPGQRFVDGHVALTLAERGSDAPNSDTRTFRASILSIGAAPVPVGPRGATHTLEVSAATYWAAVAARLVRDARKQLPKKGTGAVMIGLPLAGAAQAAKEKVESLIRQAEYANTPWIALWAQGGALAVYRNGQPFDVRLSA